MKAITILMCFLVPWAFHDGQEGISSDYVAPNKLMDTSSQDGVLENIKLPPGFRIDYFAENVENARTMAYDPRGILYVGSRNAGHVYAVIDRDKDYKADGKIKIVEGLKMPNGVALDGDDLYVAELSRILKFESMGEQLLNGAVQFEYEVIYDGYPDKTHHGWKYLAIGPDDKLYVPVGAPCNVCESEEIFASITRMNKDGSGMEIVQNGIRNTVGFTWDPSTHYLWFTDNGRDNMGDNQPFDELNVATRKGLHFGFPYCHQGDIPDPDYGEGKDCSQYTPPALNLGPHVAALGLKFYTSDQFPEEYRNKIFIAEHGSWNRLKKIGYRITMATVNGNEASDYQVFAEGWLQDETTKGRPVDILILPDGSMLVSDDHHNAIYRISYVK